MMIRIGVISDIHSDIDSLDVAIDRLYKENVSKIYVCGDVVGYGKHPDECCERLRQINATVVAGNHDWAVAGRTNYLSTFGVNAVAGIEFTRRVISDPNLNWLKELPLHRQVGQLEFVHSSLHEPHTWPYLVVGSMPGQSQWQDVRQSFAAMTGRICFLGHSHRPAVFLESPSGEIDVVDPFETWMDLSKERAVVDVGSISDPRDGSGYGHAFVYDTSQSRLKMLRLHIRSFI